MMTDDQQPSPSLGQYLEEARKQARYTLRQLATESGITLSSIYRLISDDVDRPSTENLMTLAKVLHLDPAEVFARAGISAPSTDLDTLLRSQYGLPDQAIAQIHAIIAANADQKGERP
ncbi:helix-turn-helix domain-containing protein [Nonomuraea sp. NBC_01738]|uniref:helix-turn-helix domain-containing protein n=1 Tax=Nonomuraea sp. NBC_01738 TaxID=2976003 RepID=UPI002E12DF5D|nr:helix-turn-helix domain-containing protein [Nonomuraea sp. NBC_01738]